MDQIGPLNPDLLTQRGIGVVAPFDFALDRELWRWVPDDVSLFTTRLPYTPEPVTVEMAAALSDPRTVARATRDVLVPEPLAVAYACASGSFVHGAAGERILTESILAAGAPAATTSSGALVEALRRLAARRVAVVTPYIDTVTERLLSFLGQHGIEAVARTGLGLLSHIWKTSYRDIMAAVAAVDRPEAEAVFISCTNVPTYDIISPLELALGKPVLSANQVTMWSATNKIGSSATGADQRLFQAAGPALPELVS